MTGWGVAVGIIGALGFAAFARWRKEERQRNADLEEKVSWLRYYVRQHPEILNG